MMDREETPLWGNESDLPACAEEGAGREIAFALAGKAPPPVEDRGRFFLLLVCLALSFFVLFFAVALAIDKERTVEQVVETVEKEKVVFVRDWDEDSGILSTPELYAQCSQSVVTLSAYGSGKKREGFGFFIREDGYIVTDLSVVEGSDRITAQLWDGRELAAELVGSAPSAELGLLKIEARGLQALTFASSGELLLGERVVAVGADRVATGELSSLSESVFVRDEQGILEKKLAVMKMSATSLAEYAGAPLLNAYGEAVGICSSHLSEAGGGYSLPSDGILGILEAMLAGETVDDALLAGIVTYAPILGVEGGSASEDGVAGVRIHRFVSGLSSAAVMLREGDLILAVDGVAVRSPEEISKTIEKCSPAEIVRVTVLRFGQTLTFDVMLEERQ